MAEFKTTRIWEGVDIDEFTETSNGSIRLYQSGSKSASTFLATSPPSGSIEGYKWQLVNTTLFRNLYNRQNTSSDLTNTEFERLFYNEGRHVFNEDRANILNDVSNYPTEFDYYNNTKQFAQVNKIPGVIDPFTKQIVNDDGEISEYDIFGESSEPNTSGTDSNDSTFSFPNEEIVREFRGTGGLRAVPTTLETGLVGSGARSFATADGGRALSSAMLRYPEQTVGDAYDYIQIQAHEYSAKQAISVMPTGFNRLGDPIGPMMILPMIPAAESSSVDFGPDSLNPIQAKAAQVGMDTMETAYTTGGDFVAALRELGSGLMEAGKSFMADENMKHAVKAYFAGQAVGANILTRTTGSILNPNMELLFKGPKMRQFNFNFLLTPRTESESNIIRQIIKNLKTQMAPRISNESNFLYTPNIFQIQYIFNGGGQHPYLNKIKPCALTACSVNYSPNGEQYMTYPDGSMTAYGLQLSFNEIAPIYQKDQQGADGMGY